MALVIFNSTPSRGTPGQMTLDTSEVVAHASVAADAYFVDPANWSKVICFYRSTTSNQKETVVFDADGVTDPTANFSISASSLGDFEIQYLALVDKDGGTFQVERGALTPAEFDVIIATAFGIKSMLFTADDTQVNRSLVAGQTAVAAISVWVKIATVKATENQGIIPTKGYSNGDDEAGLGIGVSGGPNAGKLILMQTSTNTVSAASTFSLDDGNWHHILFNTQDANNTNFASVYVDGNPTAVIDAGFAISLQGIVIGTDSLGVNFNGNIAQLDYYVGSFSAADIAESYNGGEVLDPTTHTQAANLKASYQMGDNVLDTTTTIRETVTGTTSNIQNGSVTIVEDVPAAV